MIEVIYQGNRYTLAQAASLYAADGTLTFVRLMLSGDMLSAPIPVGSVTFPPNIPAIELDIDFSQAGSGAGFGGNYILPFTQSNLSIASILPAPHNRNSTPRCVTVLDNNQLEITPDSIDLSNPNAIAVGLQSFAPITGQWLLLACF